MVGADLSSKLIELVLQQARAQPLGISYHVQDVCALDLGQRFDLVIAAYLFNHAHNRDEFLSGKRVTKGGKGQGLAPGPWA